MSMISLSTPIKAPVARCFNLARSIDLHLTSSKESLEQAIAGVTKGLIGLGQTVTFRAKHFGFFFTLTSKITEFNYPSYFQDSMIKGPFAFIQHDHFFEQEGVETKMLDRFSYQLPLGILGKWVDRFLVHQHLYQFLFRRNQVIKQIAESNEFNLYLPS